MTIRDNNSPWEGEITRFGSGLAGRRPDPRTTQAANQLAQAAVELTLEHEAYLDDADGTLGFMLRLNNGLLLLAELSADGVLSGGTYHDREGGGRQVEFIGNASVNQMLELLQGKAPPRGGREGGEP